ncbi:VgrG-related protein [Streptomyces sp. NPDC085932]|uniref:VgrG-related protein n=1 Tax=Streptomyces sp. NPDC085932 TaxID=3365741 RepID=UPI0037D77362
MSTAAPPAPSASIRVGTAAQPLSDDLQLRVLRAVVDSRRNAPTMIEISFRDDEADVLERAGLRIGVHVEVWASPSGPGAQAALVGGGEVTALEGDYVDLSVITTVRAYDRSHRLQRGSRVRTFVNMTDSDIARRIAEEAGLPVGTIEATRTSHTHLGQMNQTDWDFLSWRCREIGYEFGLDEGGFFFRPVSARGGAPLPLKLQHNLRAFRPRVTAAALVPELEMRVWDPLRARAVSTQAKTDGTAVDLTGADVTSTLEADGDRPRPPATAPAPSTLGPAPSANGLILTGTSPAAGAAIAAASREALQGPAGRLGGSLAEAQAVTWGDPRLRPGAEVKITGPPRPFAGNWSVNCARHVFDLTEGGYRTHLQLGDPEDRSLLHLADAGGIPHRAPRIHGFVCGVVTDVNDPAGGGRVKVVLPWLAPDHETDWAPVVQAAGGRRAGALLLPEVGDQVLLGFELGDPRRPYVVGGVLSASSTYAPGGPAVEATGRTAEVVRRGIVSPTGNMLAFHDKVPPGAGGAPTASSVVLGTGDGTLALAIDQVAGTVTLSCRPQPKGGRAAAGRLRIDCGDGGNIDLRAGAGGEVRIDGGSTLSLRAQTSISIESAGTVAIKGAQIKLN